MSAVAEELQVLRQTEVAFEGVIYGKANGSRRHNLHVVQAEAGKQRARPLLSNNQSQSLPGGSDLRRLWRARLMRLQTLHLRQQQQVSTSPTEPDVAPFA